MIGDAIRRFRQEQNLTMRQLASMIGVTDSYISLLEKNAEDPSVAVLRRLSQALKHPISAFFDEECSAPGIIVGTDRPIHRVGMGEVTWELLTAPSAEETGPAMFRISIAPGTVLHCEGIPSQACIYLQEGNLSAIVSDTAYDMQEWDSLYLQSGVAFTAENRSAAAVVCIVSLSGQQLPAVRVERRTL